LRSRARVCARWVLPQPGRAEQEDVALRQLDVVTADDARRLLVLDPPIVVVDGDGEDLLRLALADDVVVEERADLDRGRQLLEAQLTALGELLLDDLVAEVDALVADVDARARDQLLDLLLLLPQKLHFSSSPVSPNFATSRRSLALVSCQVSGSDRCGRQRDETSEHCR
jgi:hypothetical protein